MSALELPELRRRLLGRYRSLRWQKRRRSAAVVIALILVGGFMGFHAQIALRVAVEGPLSSVALSATERRALELIRPIGFGWTSVLSAEQVGARLSASPDAAALAAMLDALPSPTAVSEGGWLARSSSGKIGRGAAIGLIARSIADQPPHRRVPLAALLVDLAASADETRELVTWVAELPQEERARLRSLRSGPLMTAAGRAAVVALSALPADQVRQCQESARLTPQDWSKLQPWAQANSGQLAAFRQLAQLPGPQIQRLSAIASAYTGPGRGFGDAPYPCLDRPGQNWVRDGRRLFTCTIALH